MTPCNDSITRRECPVHGDTITLTTDWCISSESHDAPCRERVERVYVAVDALLSDEAIEAAERAVYAEWAKDETTTKADARTMIEAAIAAASSEEGS